MSFKAAVSIAPAFARFSFGFDEPAVICLAATPGDLLGLCAELLYP